MSLSKTPLSTWQGWRASWRAFKAAPSPAGKQKVDDSWMPWPAPDPATLHSWCRTPAHPHSLQLTRVTPHPPPWHPPLTHKVQEHFSWHFEWLHDWPLSRKSDFLNLSIHLFWFYNMGSCSRSIKEKNKAIKKLQITAQKIENVCGDFQCGK